MNIATATGNYQDALERLRVCEDEDERELAEQDLEKALRELEIAWLEYNL